MKVTEMRLPKMSVIIMHHKLMLTKKEKGNKNSQMYSRTAGVMDIYCRALLVFSSTFTRSSLCKYESRPQSHVTLERDPEGDILVPGPSLLLPTESK